MSRSLRPEPKIIARPINVKFGQVATREPVNRGQKGQALAVLKSPGSHFQRSDAGRASWQIH